jgi:hypothetical protein
MQRAKASAPLSCAEAAEGLEAVLLGEPSWATWPAGELPHAAASKERLVGTMIAAALRALRVHPRARRRATRLASLILAAAGLADPPARQHPCPALWRALCCRCSGRWRTEQARVP